ncbi:uncharacterized protein LOC109365514 isoform X2 [Meleagris gallopavo]|uniref:uncharacterized protein LOC109365514 isoform X2 n=1 Tax=Meleagris gallopavo TaxID=9103 RepID=UPI0012ABAC1C|nr:uncharacterized protein LOC109365514 isoform X2 [Meleagris gallopavo]
MKGVVVINATDFVSSFFVLESQTPRGEHGQTLKLPGLCCTAGEMFHCRHGHQSKDMYWCHGLHREIIERATDLRQPKAERSRMVCKGGDAQRRTRPDSETSWSLLHSWRDVPSSTWTSVQRYVIKRTPALLQYGHHLLATNLVIPWACHRWQNAYSFLCHPDHGTSCLLLLCWRDVPLSTETSVQCHRPLLPSSATLTEVSAAICEGMNLRTR